MPFHNTYCLTWISLSLDEGYLLMATPPDLECGVAPLDPPGPHSCYSLYVGLLLSASVPYLVGGVARLGQSL